MKYWKYLLWKNEMEWNKKTYEKEREREGEREEERDQTKMIELTSESTFDNELCDDILYNYMYDCLNRIKKKLQIIELQRYEFLSNDIIR